MWTLPFLRKMQALLPLLLRLAVGWHFADAGFRELGGRTKWDWGRSYIESWFSGHSFGLLTAILVVQFATGVGVLVGALTRWSALLLSLCLGYALFHIHWGKGFHASSEDVRLALAGALAVLFLGPGRFSVDRVLFGKRAME